MIGKYFSNGWKIFRDLVQGFGQDCGMMKTESRRAAELVVLGIIGGLLTVFLFMGAGWCAGRFEVWTGKGGWIPAETGPHAEWMPFLQGGTDWGGGAMYAVEAMAGVVYLVLASWLLALWMAQVRKVSPDGAGWGKRTLRALWFFAPYAVAWVTVWIVAIVTDRGFARHTSSQADGGVLMATVALVGVLTAAWTAWVDGRRWWTAWKVLAAPAAVALWVFMAWDGQTPRAGQRLWSGQEPLPAVRGWRHAVMLAWYDLWVERPEEGGEDAWLWFWTDGRNEFGTRLEDSPSAHALRKRSDLPWTGGRTVFVVPLAAGPETEVEKAMPYHAQMRHYGGYFFRTPDGVLPIRRGAVHSLRKIYSMRPAAPLSWAWREVDVHLRSGTPYWLLWMSREGGVEGRLLAFTPSRSHPPEAEEVLASASSLEDVLSGEGAPVVVGIAEDVTLGALADCLGRLDAAGFDEVFVD